jgi:hypothetical protein
MILKSGNFLGFFWVKYGNMKIRQFFSLFLLKKFIGEISPKREIKNKKSEKGSDF